MPIVAGAKDQQEWKWQDLSGDDIIKRNRELMKQLDWETSMKQKEPDQRKGIPPPSPQKPPSEGAELIELVRPDDISLGRRALIDLIRQRRSRRDYTEESLSVEELSFLLWATQGVQQVLNRGRTMRTVPAGGALHPFETYLIIRRVEKIQSGIYRYLPLEHRLTKIRELDLGISKQLQEAIPGDFVRDAAVVFLWTVIPYRKEWRYGTIAYKDILLDAGHVCQNLYLACEAIQAGTCAILSYNQMKADALLNVDGEDEYTVYTATVGKIEVV